MPNTQRPEKNRNDVLNPAMERRPSGSGRRQMGRRCVEEDTNENVNHDEKASCAKESLEKVHLGSHPLGGRLGSPAAWLPVILPSSEPLPRDTLQ